MFFFNKRSNIFLKNKIIIHYNKQYSPYCLGKCFNFQISNYVVKLSITSTNLNSKCSSDFFALQRSFVFRLKTGEDMTNYLKLITSTSPYGKRMTYLRNRIFGDVVRNTDESSMRVVKRIAEEPFYAKKEIINYYPRHKEMYYLTLKLRDYGLYRDEYLDFKEETRRARRERGKIAPQKGKGKQAENR